MHLLYVLFSWLAGWLVLPVVSLMSKTRQGFWQRQGFYPEASRVLGRTPRIWLHGASAGDLLALSPMIDRLRARLPHAAIIVSTMTNTGHLMGVERMKGKTDAVIYVPWDFVGATHRAVAALKPDLLVLEYTEIWPNLIHAAHAAGCRIAVTNGRFSQQHLGRYRTLFTLIGNPLQQLDALLMRTDEEAERVRSLGAPAERVHVTGNTKFDALVPASEAPQDETLRRALGLTATDRVLILGSTHEGEEELLIRAWHTLRAEFPDLKLVIAPRYIDRTARVVELVRQTGVAVGLRSQGVGADVPCVVLDTIGELSRAYRLATVVFVGGSFTTRGGQNILEPAAQGKPVLFGPNMQNFADSVQILVGRGGIQVNDEAHLVRVMRDLLARPESIESVGALAAQTVRQISGASDRNVDMLVRLLPRGGTP